MSIALSEHVLAMSALEREVADLRRQLQVADWNLRRVTELLLCPRCEEKINAVLAAPDERET